MTITHSHGHALPWVEAVCDRTYCTWSTTHIDNGDAATTTAQAEYDHHMHDEHGVPLPPTLPTLVVEAYSIPDGKDARWIDITDTVAAITITRHDQATTCTVALAADGAVNTYPDAGLVRVAARHNGRAYPLFGYGTMTP